MEESQIARLRHLPGPLSLDLPHEMTQLPHDEFETSLEKAEAWMKEIQERLKENDNTQGPRSALECRLRETEKICALEPDGKLLLDLVLSKADNILGESSDDEKHEIHIKLGKIKAMFEETATYMTHCHSRIEWVWLHWNEYLRTRDEFMAWAHDMTLMLEPDVELQLGRKEKCWQFEQSQVLLRDVNNHSKLLDRLLEEASSLYNRIGDPSVDESVQSAMVSEYKQIKKKTQERTKCLEKIWRDHEAYEKEINLFKSWLNGVIEKLKCCVGSASESTETRLNMLQEIGKDVEVGKKQLLHLEEKSAEVIKDTSPMGAEKICRELEELRRTLDELKVMNDEEEEGLLKTYNSDNAFAQLAVQLEANINEFRKAVQRLEESLESGEKVKTEDELIALWKTLNATKSSLAALEAIAERVKVQLKDLFKFSKDIQPLSDSVIAAMREYQRAKSKAFKLSTDTESELRQLFQNPLLEFLYWKPIAESVLDSTDVAANNGSANPDALDRIEKLLEESGSIKENLSALEAKQDGIHSVLGDDRTKLLLRDVATAEAERAALYRDLLERRSQLQSLAVQSEEFDAAWRLLQKKVSALRKKGAKENELQPDIKGKEAQLQRLQTLLDQLAQLHSPITELNSKMEASPNHSHRASKLLSEYLKIQSSLENNFRKTKESINVHRMFSNDLLELQRWTMEARRNLETYLEDSHDWTEPEVEALLVEVSEKDVRRRRVEAQGQLVIDSSSPEGAAFIHTELTQLLESWESLRRLCERLSRYLKERARQRRSPTTVITNQTSNFLSDGESHSPPRSPAETTNPGTDFDGYSSSSSSMADNGDTSNTRTQTGHLDSDKSNRGKISGKGDSGFTITEVHKGGSGSNESDRGNISGRGNSSFTITEVDSVHKGGSGSDESNRGKISGKGDSSFTITEVDSVHKGGSGRITSPADGSGSSEKISGGTNKTNGKSRIPGPAGTSRSSDTSSKSAKRSTQINITNGKAGDESNRGNISGKGDSSFTITEVDSVHHGGSSSSDNESNRGNTPGRGGSSFTITEVESVHKGGASSDESNRGNISGKGDSGISMVSVHKGGASSRNNESNRGNISGKGDSGISLVSVHKGGASSDESNRGKISGKGDSGISLVSVHKGGASSDESNRGNTSGRGGSGFAITEEESAHKGGSGSAGGREELNNKTRFTWSPNKTKIGTRIISGNAWNDGEKNSPNTWGTSRRNRKTISLAESVDAADCPPAQSIGGDKTEDDHTKLLVEFEQWLNAENVKLNRVCAEKSSGRAGTDAWRSALQMLKSRVPQGQNIFEGLLRCRPAMSVTEDLRLEDLRYRWMLYKSKLRDSGIHATQNVSHEPRDVTKKSGGLCSFLHRVCCAALPLQLLLLLLLLLAFLLPLVHESQNCALANNFARSFNLMLKYDGPPPT